VLYWITNNVLSIAQQWFINKRLGVLGNPKKPKAPTLAKPGK
jgi:YidC/Oxa1 family membrane protein insertase